MADIPSSYLPLSSSQSSVGDVSLAPSLSETRPRRRRRIVQVAMSEIAINVAISIISKSGSSDHKKSFPGKGLTPSRITCGQGNNILQVAAKYKGSYEVKVLLDCYPSLALESNAKGDTPLHIAARLGKLDMVTCLVQGPEQHTYKRFEVEADYRNLLQMVNNKRNTALHEAVLSGNCDIAELLIKADATLASFDNEAGESPLFLAVDAGYEKIALSILKTFPGCSLTGRNGMTVMHAAVIRAQYRKIDKPLPTIAHVIRSILKHDDGTYVMLFSVLPLIIFYRMFGIKV